MDLTISFVDKIDPIAMYAAVVATCVLVWDILKWIRSGVRLRGSASTNMKTFGVLNAQDENTYVVFNVANRGTHSTTITTVGFLGYSSFFHRLMKKNKRAGVFASPTFMQQVPHLLAPGERFMTACIQDEELIEWSKEGNLYGAIYHTASDRPMLLRVSPIDN